MGNTCYMNASLQCLRRIPEFKEAAMKSKNSTDPFTGELHKLISRLETKGDAFMPYGFFTVFFYLRFLSSYSEI